MYKHILHTIEGLNWLTIVPTVLFFVMFVFIVIRLIRKDKAYINHMENLPLDD